MSSLNLIYDSKTLPQVLYKSSQWLVVILLQAHQPKKVRDYAKAITRIRINMLCQIKIKIWDQEKKNESYKWGGNPNGKLTQERMPIHCSSKHCSKNKNTLMLDLLWGSYKSWHTEHGIGLDIKSLTQTSPFKKMKF